MGLAVAAICAICGFAFGIWPAVWAWVASVAVYVWKAATFRVPIPLALVLIAGIWVVFTLVRIFRRSYNPLSQEVRTQAVKLSDNQNAIIRFFADADGRFIQLHWIAEELKLPKLRAGQEVDELCKKQLLASLGLAGDIYRLTDAGRDYAIAQGYVK